MRVTGRIYFHIAASFLSCVFYAMAENLEARVKRLG